MGAVGRIVVIRLRLALLARVVRPSAVDVVGILGIEVFFEFLCSIEVKLFL